MIAFVPYATCLALLSYKSEVFATKNIFWIVIGSAIIFHTILIGAPPVFSDDIYRYVWDGKVMASGCNPYQYPPADEALAHLKEPWFDRINHPSLRTIYPPAAQLFFGFLSIIWANPIFFKAVISLFNLAIGIILFLILGGKLKNKTRKIASPKPKANDAPAAAILATAAWCLNPLVCIETSMNGHLEPVAILPLLCFLFILKNRRKIKDLSKTSVTGSGLAASFLLSLSIATKLAPLVLLPTIFKTHKKLVLTTIAMVGVLYLLFSSAGINTIETAGTFTRKWEGNSGVYTAVKASTGFIIAQISPPEGPYEMVHLPFMDKPAMLVQNTFFSLHKDGGFDPQKPGAFTVDDISAAISKILLTCVLLLVIGKTVVTQRPFEQTFFWILGTLVLITPILHPWYIFWVLPFAILCRSWSWLVFSGVLFLAYLPLDNWWRYQQWQAPWWIPTVEYTMLLVSFLFFKRSKKQIPPSLTL